MFTVEELRRRTLAKRWPMPANQLALLSGIIGQDVGDILEVNPDKVEKARAWINSDPKKHLESALATVALGLGGWLVIRGLEAYSARFRGGEGLFTLAVGFLGSKSEHRYIKIGTMLQGAQSQRLPWQETSIIAGDDVADDHRVIPELGILRRLGLDELSQLRQVRKGEIRLISPRGQSGGELKMTKSLCDLADCPELQVDDLSRRLLKKYPAIMQKHDPKPGLISLLSATTAKETRHLVRMLGEVAYLYTANPALDIRLVFATALSRFKGVGAR